MSAASPASSIAGAGSAAKSLRLLLRLPGQLTGPRKFLLGFLLCLAYVLRRLRWQCKVARLPRIPGMRPNLLLMDFGTLLRELPRVQKTENRPDLISFWQASKEKTRAEGLFCMSFFHWLLPMASSMVVVHDHKLIRHLLGKGSFGLFKKGKSYRIASDLIGTRGLLASPDNDLWHWQRRLLSPAFRRHLFDDLLAPSVRRHVAAMCERWEAAAADAGGERPKVDIVTESLRLTLSVLGSFAFGATDFGSGAAHDGDWQPLDEAFACVLHRMTSFGRNPLLYLTRWVPTQENRRYWHAFRSINRAALASIDGRLEKAGAGGKIDEGLLGDDLLGHMLRAAHGGEGGRMDRGLLTENLRTFLFAGHDTTASALTWALQLLATHPEEAALLRKELEGVKPGDEGLIACNTLETLPRLEAVVREVLRLYPSAGLTRESLKDVELGEYILPRGTEIFVIPYLVHRDEQLFPNANCFEPSRWLTPDGSLKGGAPESIGWMPFSLGARNCIGAQLAKLELKLVLCDLLKRYHFEVPPLEAGEEPPKVVLYMTLVPNFCTLVPRPLSERST